MTLDDDDFSDDGTFLSDSFFDNDYFDSNDDDEDDDDNEECDDSDSSEEDGERIIQPPQRADIVDEFPDLFLQKGKILIEIPAGWLKFTKSALRVMVSTGMNVKIRAFVVSTEMQIEGYEKCRLVARTSRDDDGGAHRILNEILGQSKNLCVVCGRSTKDCASPLCHECGKDLEFD